MKITNGYARSVVLLALLAFVASVAAQPKPTPAPLTGEQRQAFEDGLRALERGLEMLRATNKVPPDNFAEAAIFAKAIAWALRYDKDFTQADIALFKKALIRGNQRLETLRKDETPWAQRRTGKVARAFVSAVDGSIQPYGVLLPKNFDPARKTRLDVVLHGSSRPVGMSELRFLNAHDEGDKDGNPGPDQDFIQIHPLGRVENCYRWAGETDVFEAIEAACRNYAIDRDRIVLRGMSMGASGTWHLGLKHPDRFVALGPYCGYVDTHQFSLTPISTFPKIGPLPWQQEKTLHMLDSVDYAANAGIVPAIAAMGDKDIFFQAHVIMGRAMEKEGLKMVNLISPGTGHVIDPVTHKEQMRQIGEYASKGLNHAPAHIRLVTWTLKYGRAHWLQIRGLGEHYARAELDATVDNDGGILVREPTNVTRFAILAGQLPKPVTQIRLGDFTHQFSKAMTTEFEVTRQGGKWIVDEGKKSEALLAKKPGQQGPIDDAFMAPFLCVRGTGSAWNPSVQAYADASLKRFAAEWHQYFRGDLPIKNDTEVTDQDVATKNLILFGDPGSNSWIAKALPSLEVGWTKEELRVGDQTYAASQYVPAMIRPNPLPKGEGRYIVINSGHTFRGKDLGTINYLLFPRLGDWAVLYIAGKQPEKGADGPAEEVIRAGFFDEQWKLKGE